MLHMEKAFDRIRGEDILKVLQKRGVNKITIEVIKDM